MTTTTAAQRRGRGSLSIFPEAAKPRAKPTYSPWEAVFAEHFHDMPPQFVRQFLRSPDEAFVPLVVGRMSRVWHRPWLLGGVFKFLARHGILVSAQGTDVPMALTMIPRYSRSGRPYNICARVFDFPEPARWDTLKAWDAGLGRIVEYIGRRGRLMVVQRTTFDAAGVLTFETERVAVRVGRRRLWLPPWFWRATMGTMRFEQRARDDDRRIDIRLSLTHSLLGEIFGYEGTFEIVRSEDPARRILA